MLILVCSFVSFQSPLSWRWSETHIVNVVSHVRQNLDCSRTHEQNHRQDTVFLLPRLCNITVLNSPELGLAQHLRIGTWHKRCILNFNCLPISISIRDCKSRGSDFRRIRATSNNRLHTNVSRLLHCPWYKVVKVIEPRNR